MIHIKFLVLSLFCAAIALYLEMKRMKRIKWLENNDEYRNNKEVVMAVKDRIEITITWLYAIFSAVIFLSWILFGDQYSSLIQVLSSMFIAAFIILTLIIIRTERVRKVREILRELKINTVPGDK